MAPCLKCHWSPQLDWISSSYSFLSIFFFLLVIYSFICLHNILIFITNLNSFLHLGFVRLLLCVSKATDRKHALNRTFHLGKGWWEWMKESEQGQAFTAEYKSVTLNRWSSLVLELLRLGPSAKEKIKKDTEPWMPISLLWQQWCIYTIHGARGALDWGR